MKKIIYLLSAIAILTSCSGDDAEPVNNPDPIPNPTTHSFEVQRAEFSDIDYYYNTLIYVNGEKANNENQFGEDIPTAQVESGDVIRLRTRLAPGELLINGEGEICIVYRIDGGEWSEPMCVTEATNDIATWYFKDGNGSDEITIE